MRNVRHVVQRRKTTQVGATGRCKIEVKRCCATKGAFTPITAGKNSVNQRRTVRTCQVGDKDQQWQQRAEGSNDRHKGRD